jgi:hypothetical protein
MPWVITDTVTPVSALYPGKLKLAKAAPEMVLSCALICVASVGIETVNTQVEVMLAFGTLKS